MTKTEFLRGWRWTGNITTPRNDVMGGVGERSSCLGMPPEGGNTLKEQWVKGNTSELKDEVAGTVGNLNTARLCDDKILEVVKIIINQNEQIIRMNRVLLERLSRQ
jgi:hypothetical protein